MSRRDHVLALALAGHRDAEIAARLGISRRTVRALLARLRCSGAALPTSAAPSPSAPASTRLPTKRVRPGDDRGAVDCDDAWVSLARWSTREAYEETPWSATYLPAIGDGAGTIFHCDGDRFGDSGDENPSNRGHCGDAGDNGDHEGHGA